MHELNDVLVVCRSYQNGLTVRAVRDLYSALRKQLCLGFQTIENYPVSMCVCAVVRETHCDYVPPALDCIGTYSAVVSGSFRLTGRVSATSSLLSLLRDLQVDVQVCLLVSLHIHIWEFPLFAGTPHPCTNINITSTVLSSITAAKVNCCQRQKMFIYAGKYPGSASFFPTIETFFRLGRPFVFLVPPFVNEIPTVPIYCLASPQPRERAWNNQRGITDLLLPPTSCGLITRKSL
uniref:AlNc14C264G9871 protein n=1 Tax=Albugo laibachii Nc14 TaxID=890382 RepID=F0WU48_9STRA|nr:AlNc14C264G9871 [Albugo laibachii Nc14]|eukprot:CCA24893.1 AlNc14C264G9871 [Albugo laibachii Nc14]